VLYFPLGGAVFGWTREEEEDSCISGFLGILSELKMSIEEDEEEEAEAEEKVEKTEREEEEEEEKKRRGEWRQVGSGRPRPNRINNSNEVKRTWTDTEKRTQMAKGTIAHRFLIPDDETKRRPKRRGAASDTVIGTTSTS